MGSFKNKGKKILLQLKAQLGGVLKETKSPYLISKCLRNLACSDYYKLVYGYYEGDADYTAIVTEKLGVLHPDKVVYSIAYGVDDQRSSGFFAIMRRTLNGLAFSEHFGFVPVITWGEGIKYYERDLEAVTTNAFEYYFLQPSEVKYTEVSECSSVIKYMLSHEKYCMERAASDLSYTADQAEINKLAQLYKKYIHLNEKTKEYIDESVYRLLKGKHTLGIHVRGTDMKEKWRNHPIVGTTEEYLVAAKEEFSTGKYEQILLCTDDQNVLDMFLESFGDILIYYSDVARTTGSVGVFIKDMEREQHRYKLGLEVLRDVYALADCDALVCGLSQVAFAARYIKGASGQEYKQLVLVDHGVRTGKGKYYVGE